MSACEEKMARLTWHLQSPAPAASFPELTTFTRLQQGSRRAYCKSTDLEISPRWADHHRCMEPADSIRRLGFARWYERRLIEGHAWFISVVFCIIAIGVYGMLRYQKILTEAELLGEHATCGACGAYARFRLISPSRVRCKCDNEWCLIQPGQPE